MGNQENDEKKLEYISAREGIHLKNPHHIPVANSIQEANDLYHWAQEDKEALSDYGPVWELVEDLPARLEALSKAEALWQTQWHDRQQRSQEWNELSQLAYDLRNRLLVDFRYAFRNHPALLKPLKSSERRKSHPKMIQDLNDLSVLGRANRQLLEAIRFDMSLLEKAAQTSVEMSALLAKTTTSRMELGSAKTKRDQAYTYLKDAVDEIRRTGRYVFRRNKVRYRGYISDHLRQTKIRQARKLKEEQEPSQSSQKGG